MLQYQFDFFFISSIKQCPIGVNLPVWAFLERSVLHLLIRKLQEPDDPFCSHSLAVSDLDSDNYMFHLGFWRSNAKMQGHLKSYACGELVIYTTRLRKHWNDYNQVFQSKRQSYMSKLGETTINYGTMTVLLSFKQKHTYSFQVNTFYSTNAGIKMVFIR